MLLLSNNAFASTNTDILLTIFAAYIHKIWDVKNRKLHSNFFYFYAECLNTLIIDAIVVGFAVFTVKSP